MCSPSCRWVLKRIKFDGEFELTGGNQFTIGRNLQSWLPIRSPVVSKEHCILKEAEDKLFVVDLNSTNGTFVNDRRILKGEEVWLKSGCTIGLGVQSVSVQDDFMFKVIRLKREPLEEAPSALKRNNLSPERESFSITKVIKKEKDEEERGERDDEEIGRDQEAKIGDDAESRDDDNDDDESRDDDDAETGDDDVETVPPVHEIGRDDAEIEEDDEETGGETDIGQEKNKEVRQQSKRVIKTSKEKFKEVRKESKQVIKTTNEKNKGCRQQSKQVIKTAKERKKSCHRYKRIVIQSPNESDSGCDSAQKDGVKSSSDNEGGARTKKPLHSKDSTSSSSDSISDDWVRQCAESHWKGLERRIEREQRGESKKIERKEQKKRKNECLEREQPQKEIKTPKKKKKRKAERVRENEINRFVAKHTKQIILKRRNGHDCFVNMQPVVKLRRLEDQKEILKIFSQDVNKFLARGKYCTKVSRKKCTASSHTDSLISEPPSKATTCGETVVNSQTGKISTSKRVKRVKKGKTGSPTVLTSSGTLDEPTVTKNIGDCAVKSARSPFKNVVVSRAVSDVTKSSVGKFPKVSIISPSNCSAVCMEDKSTVIASGASGIVASDFLRNSSSSKTALKLSDTYASPTTIMSATSSSFGGSVSSLPGASSVLTPTRTTPPSATCVTSTRTATTTPICSDSTVKAAGASCTARPSLKSRSAMQASTRPPLSTASSSVSVTSISDPTTSTDVSTNITFPQKTSVITTMSATVSFTCNSVPSTSLQISSIIAASDSVAVSLSPHFGPLLALSPKLTVGKGKPLAPPPPLPFLPFFSPPPPPPSPPPPPPPPPPFIPLFGPPHLPVHCPFPQSSLSHSHIPHGLLSSSSHPVLPHPYPTSNASSSTSLLPPPLMHVSTTSVPAIHGPRTSAVLPNTSPSTVVTLAPDSCKPPTPHAVNATPTMCNRLTALHTTAASPQPASLSPPAPSPAKKTTFMSTHTPLATASVKLCSSHDGDISDNLKPSDGDVAVPTPAVRKPVQRKKMSLMCDPLPMRMKNMRTNLTKSSMPNSGTFPPNNAKVAKTNSGSNCQVDKQTLKQQRKEKLKQLAESQKKHTEERAKLKIPGNVKVTGKSRADKLLEQMLPGRGTTAQRQVDEPREEEPVVNDMQPEREKYEVERAVVAPLRKLSFRDLEGQKSLQPAVPKSIVRRTAVLTSRQVH